MVKVIYYDLETTNLRPVSGPNGVEIVQIGAVCEDTRNKTQNRLNLYIVPTCPISRGATNVHGLTLQELIDGEKKYNNFYQPERGLDEFMEFLNDQREFNDEMIIMVAHNNWGFDSKVLQNNLDRFGVELPNNIYHFDSLDLMKKVKKGSGGRMAGCSLDASLDYFFNEQQQYPHDALQDANDCSRISEHGAKELGYGSYQQYIEAIIDAHTQMCTQLMV